MTTWDGWPLERFMYLFIAAAYLLVWVQVTLYHWRGAFRSNFMWGPVAYTPVLVIVALLQGILRGGGMNALFVIIFAIGTINGLIGTYLHLRGVASYVGGINARNLTAGPPFILPLIYAALSGLGLLVFFWDNIARALE